MRVADVFVSFTSCDRQWAFWIAQELAKLGHVPHVHEWEISAGGDIPKWMEESLEKAEHCLLVVSKTYLTKPYSSWEQRAAQWAAASKRPNFALPVLIEACELPVLLAHLKHCELHGLPEARARAVLTKFLKPAQIPAEPQPFPAGVTTAPGTTAGGAAIAFPVSADQPTWQFVVACGTSGALPFFILLVLGVAPRDALFMTLIPIDFVCGAIAAYARHFLGVSKAIWITACTTASISAFAVVLYFPIAPLRPNTVAAVAVAQLIGVLQAAAVLAMPPTLCISVTFGVFEWLTRGHRKRQTREKSHPG
jgi:TIR domain